MTTNVIPPPCLITNITSTATVLGNNFYLYSTIDITPQKYNKTQTYTASNVLPGFWITNAQF